MGFVELYRRWGKEINFIYAPERTIEGNAEELFNLPQIIACKNIISKNIAENIFQPLNVKLFTDKFVEAELAKLLCNVYRDYNFAFSNQTAILCRDLSINISKVSDLASTDYKRFPKLLPGPVSGSSKEEFRKTLILKECNLFLNAREINESIIDLIAKI